MVAFRDQKLKKFLPHNPPPPLKPLPWRGFRPLRPIPTTTKHPAGHARTQPTT